MELWFVLATAVPLLYAFINQIDKFLLDRYFQDGGVGTLLLFSTLFSFFMIPYAIWMDPSVFSIGLINMLYMFAVGALNVFLLACYLTAMDEDEPAVVVLYYQVVPVLAYIMAYFWLGERVTVLQIFAMAFIFLGTTIATFEVAKVEVMQSEDGEVTAGAPKVRFKWRTFFLMMIAATCWAAETTIGKIVILDESVYHSIFWESVAMLCLGVILFALVPKYRRGFKTALKVNSKGVLSLCVASEALYGIGNALSTHAVALQNVAIVLVLQPLQTIFVFLISIILGFVPGMQREKQGKIFMLQMAIAISLTAFGSYLLLR